MSQPNFFSEGSAPRRSDTQWKIEQKILGALADGAAGGGGSGGTVGVVDPEGAVTADPGASYFNTANNTYWAKASGTGNTGWTQLI